MFFRRPRPVSWTVAAAVRSGKWNERPGKTKTTGKHTRAYSGLVNSARGFPREKIRERDARERELTLVHTAKGRCVYLCAQARANVWTR